jgi:hypothetical protein
MSNTFMELALKEAGKQETKARNERKQAVEAQRVAEKARLESIEQRRQAEESSYFAEIGLVGASIQQNQFSTKFFHQSLLQN